MDRKRRSPYLVLGIDYGASAAEARRAFALKSRITKQQSETPYDIHDLTWALQEVEQAEEGHGGSVDYFRVPAHRTGKLEVPEGLLFTPQAAPAPRRTTPTADERDAFERQWITDALQLLAGSISTFAHWPPSYD